MKNYTELEQPKTTVVSKGIGFTGLLQLVFIVLKLCNVITWKWVFVLMPLIVDAGIGILVVLFYIIVLLILRD